MDPRLPPVSEKSLPAKCRPSSLSYCPTMDLIALVTEDHELRVFRLNGQRVFGGSFGRDPYLDGDGDEDEDDGGGEIRGVKWKGNGRSLAVACADNTIRIISAYSGKTVHHYPVYRLETSSSSGTESDPIANPAPAAPPVTAKVTCLGWGENFTDRKAALTHLHDAAGRISVEDLLSSDMPPAKVAALLKADLPRELALLDIESSLPKLSTLPATGTDDDVFSSRASIDAIFHSASTQTATDAVDVLLVGFDDGTFHLRIYDCFEIGSLRVGHPTGAKAPCRIGLHASHPLSSTHALLVSAGASGPESGSSKESLHLVTLDLRFITRSGRYLSLLAHKTTQLQNLLRYICQVQRQIELEWKNTQELPARYMRSVNEDLKEKCHCDFVTAAFHLVVTGDCFEPMKEFLVDIVGERGHKRWEKAVSSGYENVRRLTHECLLPALERSEVLLSRLVGLSKFHKLSEVLGLETSDLNAIVETLDCLHLIAHHIIIHTNEELSQFNCFSAWLRHEIDIQSAEPMSQTLEELQEKTDLVSYPHTLNYIRGALTKSALRNFIQQLPMAGAPRPPPSSAPSHPDPDKWAPTGGHGHDRSFYDAFKKLLAQKNKGVEEAKAVELPKINDLTKRLGIQFEKVFAQIALTQRRGILDRSPLALNGDCDGGVVDLAMRWEDVEEDSLCSIYLASRSIKSKHRLYIYRVVLDSESGVSSTRKTSIGGFDLQEGEIRQVQFVADDTIMVLWSKKNGSTYLLNFPFQPASISKTETLSPSIQYTEGELDSAAAIPARATPALDIAALESTYTDLVKHSFAAAGAKATPARIDVNGRAGRRAVCVLYGDCVRYEVLDLDAEMEHEEEGE